LVAPPPIANRAQWDCDAQRAAIGVEQRPDAAAQARQENDAKHDCVGDERDHPPAAVHLDIRLLAFRNPALLVQAQIGCAEVESLRETFIALGNRGHALLFARYRFLGGLWSLEIAVPEVETAQVRAAHVLLAADFESQPEDLRGHRP
jgi:hypothetical protein